jgi:hypothetical protein
MSASLYSCLHRIISNRAQNPPTLNYPKIRCQTVNLFALLSNLERELQSGGTVAHLPLEKLAEYYHHLAELAKGYEKDPAKLEENLRYVNGWRDEVEQLSQELT